MEAMEVMQAMEGMQVMGAIEGMQAIDAMQPARWQGCESAQR